MTDEFLHGNVGCGVLFWFSSENREYYDIVELNEFVSHFVGSMDLSNLLHLRDYS